MKIYKTIKYTKQSNKHFVIVFNFAASESIPMEKVMLDQNKK